MNIEIDPAQVEILDKVGMSEIHAWARYRGHEFPFCSMGYSATLLGIPFASREVLKQYARFLAAQQLKVDIAAMSAHQRLAFFAETQAAS